MNLIMFDFFNTNDGIAIFCSSINEFFVVNKKNFHFLQLFMMKLEQENNVNL